MAIAVLRVPKAFISESATPEQKEYYELLKAQFDRLLSGESFGIVLPSDFDLETRTPLFDIEIKGV